MNQSAKFTIAIVTGAAAVAVLMLFGSSKPVIEKKSLSDADIDAEVMKNVTGQINAEKAAKEAKEALLKPKETIPVKKIKPQRSPGFA